VQAIDSRGLRLSSTPNGSGGSSENLLPCDAVVLGTGYRHGLTQLLEPTLADSVLTKLEQQQQQQQQLGQGQSSSGDVAVGRSERLPVTDGRCQSVAEPTLYFVGFDTTLAYGLSWGHWVRNAQMQHSTAQHSTAQHSAAQRSTAQHSSSTAQHSTAQRRAAAAQHSTAQRSAAQHSTLLHSVLTIVRLCTCRDVHCSLSALVRSGALWSVWYINSVNVCVPQGWEVGERLRHQLDSLRPSTAPRPPAPCPAPPQRQAATAGTTTVGGLPLSFVGGVFGIGVALGVGVAALGRRRRRVPTLNVR
jgi:hypothetical protein